MPTYTEDLTLDDGSGDSPKLIFKTGSDDELRLWLDDEGSGDSDGRISLCDTDGESRMIVRDSNGIQRFWVDSDGNAYFTRYVGLGVESPETRLHVQGTDEDGSRITVVRDQDTDEGSFLRFRLDRSGDGVDGDILGQIIFEGYDDGTPTLREFAAIQAISVDTDSTTPKGGLAFLTRHGTGDLAEAMRIYGSRGNVGIGTSTPYYHVDIEGDSGDDGALRLKQTFDSLSYAPRLILSHIRGPSTAGEDGDYLGRILFQGNNDAGTPQTTSYVEIRAESADVSDGSEDGALYFETEVAGSLVTSLALVGGQVGVGTDSPSVFFHIYDDSATVEARIETTYTNGGAELSFKNDAVQWAIGLDSGDNGYFKNDTRSVAYIFFDDAYDRVGIFENSPDCSLHVNGQVKVEGNPAKLRFEDTGQSEEFVFETGADGLSLTRDTETFILFDDQFSLTSGAIMIIGGSSTYGTVRLNGISDTLGKAVLAIDQPDDDEPFVYFIGRGDTVGKSLVDDTNVSDSDTEYWVRVAILDETPNPDHSGEYYLKLCTLTST
jgi:hypothetical protein